MSPLLITAAVSLTIGIVVGTYVGWKMHRADDTIARITTPAAVRGLPYDEDEETR